jgi:hypothetical protein
MLRQEDLGSSMEQREWPRGSPSAAFLADLVQQLGEGQGPGAPQLGQVVRVRLPATEQPLDFSPPRRALTRGGAGASPLLRADRGSVELEVCRGRIPACLPCTSLAHPVHFLSVLWGREGVVQKERDGKSQIAAKKDLSGRLGKNGGWFFSRVRKRCAEKFCTVFGPGPSGCSQE